MKKELQLITAKLVKNIIKTRKMSVYEFAKEVGCSYITANNWVKGNNEVSNKYKGKIFETYFKRRFD